MFEDYDSTVVLASRIKAAIRHGGRGRNVGYMPPFFAADDGSRFQDYRTLTESEIHKIEQWIDDEMPKESSEWNINGEKTSIALSRIG